MFKLDRSYIAILVLLGMLSFFPLTMPASLTISEEMSPFFRDFPLVIGSWQGTETPTDERTLEILETRNVLSRNYVNAGGAQAHLLMVSSRSDRRVAHPPEVCYTGSNYNIFDTRETVEKIEGLELPLKEFRAVNERNPGEQVYVLYLYKIGDRYTTNYYSQQFQFALDRFTQSDSEVLLIRLAGKNKSSLKDFLYELMPRLK